MEYRLALLISLFMFNTSNSVRLVFQVENTFFNKNPIILEAVDPSGHILGEQTVQYRNNMTWELPMNRYQKTLTYLCHVTELQKSGDEKTYLGNFEAFNASWLRDYFDRLHPDRTIIVLWFVFEAGAVTKLDPELGGQHLWHRWLKIKFVVVNDFNEEVELTALNGDGSIAAKGTVLPKKIFLWIRFVTSKTRNFSYKFCARATEVTGKQTREFGIVTIFNSSSITRERLKEAGTLEVWWSANESGVRIYNPNTGRYSNEETSWPSSKKKRTSRFQEGKKGNNEERRRKRKRNG